MKLFKQARKYGRKAVVVVAGGAASLAAGVAGATGIDISAATGGATTDVQAAGALIVGVVVAIAAIAWIRRVVH